MNGLQSSVKNGLILAAFALLSTGLTTMTWVMTKDQIQSEKEKALLRAIAELVPADRFANDPYADCTLITHEKLLGSKEPQPTWRLRDEDGKPVAAVISSVAPNGYNGRIEIIVGHYFKQSLLAGARVTAHKETPGLGDKIEAHKSRWILQFNETSTQQLKMDDWQVKKDGGQYDAFTGATITPRAVLLAIGKNIDYFNQHQQDIFSAPSNCFVEENP